MTGKVCGSIYAKLLPAQGVSFDGSAQPQSALGLPCPSVPATAHKPQPFLHCCSCSKFLRVLYIPYYSEDGKCQLLQSRRRLYLELQLNLPLLLRTSNMPFFGLYYC
jgi:hypothetical protein